MITIDGYTIRAIEGGFEVYRLPNHSREQYVGAYPSMIVAQRAIEQHRAGYLRQTEVL